MVIDRIGRRCNTQSMRQVNLRKSKGLAYLDSAFWIRSRELFTDKDAFWKQGCFSSCTIRQRSHRASFSSPLPLHHYTLCLSCSASLLRSHLLLHHRHLHLHLHRHHHRPHLPHPWLLQVACHPTNLRPTPEPHLPQHQAHSS